MAILKTFCCCNPLKVGGIIVGLFGIMKSIAIGIGAQIYIFSPSIEAGSNDHIMLEIIFGFAFISLVANIQLIIGSLSEKHRLLLPWLITQFLFLLCFFIISVSDIKFAYYSTTVDKRLTIAVFALVTGGYIWLCIFSLYQEFRSKVVAIAAEDNTKSKVDSSYVRLISPTKPTVATVDAGAYI